MKHRKLKHITSLLGAVLMTVTAQGQSGWSNEQVGNVEKATKLAVEATQKTKELAGRADATVSVTKEQIQRQKEELIALDTDTQRTLENASPKDRVKLQKTLLTKKKALLEDVITLYQGSSGRLDEVNNNLQNVMVAYSDAGDEISTYAKKLEDVERHRKEGKEVVREWKVILKQLENMDRAAPGYLELRHQDRQSVFMLTKLAKEMNKDKVLAEMYKSFDAGFNNEMGNVADLQDYLLDLSYKQKENAMTLQHQLEIVDVQLQGVGISEAFSDLNDIALEIFEPGGIDPDLLVGIGKDLGFNPETIDLDNLPEIKQTFSREELMEMFE